MADGTCGKKAAKAVATAKAGSTVAVARRKARIVAAVERRRAELIQLAGDQKAVRKAYRHCGVNTDEWRDFTVKMDELRDSVERVRALISMQQAYIASATRRLEAAAGGEEPAAAPARANLV